MTASRLPHVSGRFRVNACAVLGVVVGAGTALIVPWQLAVLAGWGVLCLALLAWVWIEIGRCDAAHTERLSTIEDPTHSTAAVVMVTASVMSLVGVALGLLKARQGDGGMEVALTVSAVLAVVLSWLVVHSMFTLRYAHEYYTSPVGGITFAGGEAPDYLDFAYFAFTVGMAFAVSDAVATSRRIRRVTLRHALVSYLFGAVIVGLTINVMAGFIR